MGILKSIQNWSVNQRKARELGSFSDRALKDIGLVRSDLPGVAREFTLRM